MILHVVVLARLRALQAYQLFQDHQDLNRMRLASAPHAEHSLRLA
jgi:hypothetical protein